MDASWVTGLSSSLVMGDEEGDDDIGEGGAGKDASGMLSADKGTDVSCGESMSGDGGSDMIPMDKSCDDRGGLSGGRKRRLGTPSESALEEEDGTAAERVRLFFFSPNCHFRTPPLALALARRARDTAFRPKVTRPRRGLTPADLVPVPAFRLGLGWGEKRGDKDGGNGERRGSGDDSSSSVSSALSSHAFCGSNDGDCPRLVKMFRARLKGEMGGDCT